MLPAWHAHPDVWLLIAVLGGGYAWAVRRIGPQSVHPIERAATKRQVVTFGGGLAVMWFSADWPVHDLAESYLYSVHMVQHLLLTFVAAPLLLLGTPDWLLRRLMYPPVVARVVRFVTRPIIALALFNIAVAASHAPAVVNASVHSEFAHFTIHTVLFLTALCMWWPVLGRLIDFPQLSHPGKMFYLFLQSLVPTVPASFLTFGDTVLYRFYASVPRLWGVSALTDQRVAGLIMKLVGGFLLWGVIGWYFFKWFEQEEREGVDALSHRDLEPGLDRVGSR